MLGMGYKEWMVIAQVIGYAFSKFIGIKIIAEITASSRAIGISSLVLAAGLSWFFFGLVSAPYNLLFLFTNGLSLGMVWGMIFSYLEGRRMTEVLGAALSVSFIFSSGLCRTTGAILIQEWQIAETWMPALASAIFTIPLLACLWLIEKLPPPSKLDEQLRTKRQPMNKKERKAFIKSFFPGIVLFIIAYMLLTTFRDFRDNFSAEVWGTLGFADSAAIYTQTEIPVSLIVLVVMGSLMLIRNNKLALQVNHLIIIVGMLLIGISTFLFDAHFISAPFWMTLIGLGLYLGYVPFNSMFFDRLIAAFQYVGTVGFIMYVADSFGYLGSVSVILLKNLIKSELSWLEIFINAGYIISVSGTLLILGSMIYFHRKHLKWTNRKHFDSFQQKTHYKIA